MNKRDLRIRQKAYEKYKDRKELYKFEGAVGKFDIDMAVNMYEAELSEKRKKKLARVLNVDVSELPEYNIDKLFFKSNKKIVRYGELEREWNKLLKAVNYYNERKNCSYLYKWLHAYIEYNNIELKKKLIIYNDRHYALRCDKLLYDEGEIYDVNDYIKYTGGTVMKYSYGYESTSRISSKKNEEYSEKDHRIGNNDKIILDLIKQYYYVFDKIGVKDQDLMFVHILNLLIINTDLKSWLHEWEHDKDIHNYFSPMTLKNIIANYAENNRTLKGLKIKDTKAHRFQHFYAEPGFEKEARQNYKEDKEKMIVCKICEGVEYCKMTGTEVNNINVYVCANRKHKMTYRKFIELVNKYGIEMKRYKIEKTEETHVEKGIDYMGREVEWGKPVTKTVFKKSERKTHKQQERSKWHEMVDNGATYDEVIKVYPEVSNKTYRNYKCKIKRNV